MKKIINYDTRRKILDKYMNGMTVDELAEVYKVSRGAINSIVHSKLTRMIGL
ncbi:hypothetical protein [uncultured Clostridium sp.]|uniref:hypothetical protein n=1 Tax=uncultured Clostridium sp. TaxID=59620 RepID=UPI0026121DF5|nr:hypothetical protein [uncultured Clostridium sp.]